MTDLLICIITMCTIKTIFKLIDDFEALIQKRKLDSCKIYIIKDKDF